MPDQGTADPRTRAMELTPHLGGGPRPHLWLRPNRCCGTLASVPRAFQQVDVFTTTPYLGNPVAVVLDAEGLSDTDMQRFARWTNLSETTFVLPPSDGGADYQVRIFTPSLELPFAGHPTLGTCHAWLGAGGALRQDGVIVQQCGAGLVRVRHTEDG